MSSFTPSEAEEIMKATVNPSGVQGEEGIAGGTTAEAIAQEEDAE
jgi:hypothetical protein